MLQVLTSLHHGQQGFSKSTFVARRCCSQSMLDASQLLLKSDLSDVDNTLVYMNFRIAEFNRLMWRVKSQAKATLTKCLEAKLEPTETVTNQNLKHKGDHFQIYGMAPRMDIYDFAQQNGHDSEHHWLFPALHRM